MLELIGGVLLALITVSGVIYSARAGTRANVATARANEVIAKAAAEPENKRADAEAYENAQKINKDTVDGLVEEVKRFKGDVSELRASLTTQAREHAEALATARSLHLAEVHDLRLHIEEVSISLTGTQQQLEATRGELRTTQLELAEERALTRSQQGKIQELTAGQAAQDERNAGTDVPNV